MKLTLVLGFGKKIKTLALVSGCAFCLMVEGYPFLLTLKKICYPVNVIIYVHVFFKDLIVLSVELTFY